MRLLLVAIFSVTCLMATAWAQDPLVAKAVARIATVESAEAAMQPGDSRKPNGFWWTSIGRRSA